MSTYDDIYGDLGDYPKLPKARVFRWILEALKDLSRNTWAYTELITFLTTAGTYEYTLSPSDTSTEVIGVKKEGVQVATVNTPNPSASDSATAGALTAGKTYIYQVTGVKDTHGETLPCGEVSHLCPASKSIDLDWADIDEADSYNVYRNDGAGGLTFGILENVSTSAYTDDGDVAPTVATTPPEKSILMREIDLSNEANQKYTSPWWRTIESDDPMEVIYDGTNKIILPKTPITTNIGYQVEAVLMPNAYQTSIPGIFEKYRLEIGDYVRYKVHAHPETKTMVWHNAELAFMYRKVFLRARAELKGRQMAGFGGRLRAKPQIQMFTGGNN